MYAKQNGFTNGTNRHTVSLAAGTSSSPASGTSPSYWVTATVTETVPTTFSAVLGQRAVNVRATATAGVYAASGGCIWVLNPTASGSLRMTGTASLTSGCGVYVHSSAAGSNGAISLTGSGGITTTGQSKTSVAGTVSKTGTSYITPAAETGVTPHSPADPFAATLPAPPAAGACQPTAQFTGSSPHTIPAGTYCDQIRQSGSAVLTLTTGTYYLKAGIKVSGSAMVTATGPVTIYVAGGAIDLTGSSGINLSPPTSGTYQGISIWQPPSNTSAGVIVGSTTQVVGGLIYMPSAALTYTGTSATSAVTSIVVDTLSMVGTSSINTSASTPWAILPNGGSFLIR